MKKQFRDVKHEVIFNILRNSNKVEEHAAEIQQGSYNDSDYLTEVHRYIKTMDEARENHAYRHISSHRKWIGSFIVFGKKVVRKCLKWYIEPITIQQSQFNNAVTPSIGRMTELISSLIQSNNQITEELASLKEQQIKVTDRMNEELLSVNKEYNKSINQMKLELLYMKNQYNEITSQLLLKQTEYDNLTQYTKHLEEDMNNKDNLLNKKLELMNKRIEIDESITAQLNEMGISIPENNSIFNKMTYSQAGEDSIVAYILHVLGIAIEDVSYIDLGANHAKEMSNTYYLYNRGAKGILVEANSDLIPELKFYRHQDIILNKCVDITSGEERDFYILNGDGLSTPDLEAAKSFCAINSSLKIVDTKKIETVSYNTIVESYLGKAPTLLSIDIEGKDMEILSSIDFVNYRPLIIIIEMIGYDIKLNHRSKNVAINEFLEGQNYEEYAFSGINSIFIDKNFMSERN